MELSDMIGVKYTYSDNSFKLTYTYTVRHLLYISDIHVMYLYSGFPVINVTIIGTRKFWDSINEVTHVNK